MGALARPAAPVTVRAARADEGRALFDLTAAVYRSTDFMCQSFEEKYPAVSDCEAELAATLADPGSIWLVAEEAGRLVGYITLRRQSEKKLRHTSNLNMGIHPEARGRSVGRRLLDAVMERARSEGAIEIVYLHVRSDNPAAVRLYETAGFQRLAVLDRDTRIGDRYYDAVLMRRFLV
jgi:ribosomal protein S18 acetylase RimI-like enzyme